MSNLNMSSYKPRHQSLAIKISLSVSDSISVKKEKPRGEL